MFKPHQLQPGNGGPRGLCLSERKVLWKLPGRSEGYRAQLDARIRKGLCPSGWQEGVWESPLLEFPV